jgi:hypothetical protein
MPDIEVELVAFILVYNYVMVADEVKGDNNLRKSERKEMESGDNITTQE